MPNRDGKKRSNFIQKAILCFFLKKKKTSFKIFREFIFNFVCSYPLIFDLVIYKAIAIIICMLCLCIYYGVLPIIWSLCF